jgi:hypothetical protein
MQRLLAVLNSPIGLLLVGAVISGLLVNFIASRWQQNDWLFQQRFTAARAQFEKQLEQKYKLLEDVNLSVADILTHSQLVVVGHQKQLANAQLSALILSYNDAVLKWDSTNRLFAIRLKTIFADPELEASWEKIRMERDQLDVAIYRLTAGGATENECMKLIESISSTSALLSSRMLTDINALQDAPRK